MKKMIITADDYGMCTIVDRAIDDCIEAGILTSTNVIVNMEDLVAAKTLRQRFPNISIGMHWNITAGKPVSSIDRIRTLVDNEGKFYKVSEFLKRYKKGLIKDTEIEIELMAQYDIFKTLCGKADYWNTHQNSALNFQTFRVFNRTALKLGIERTRSFQRTYIKEKRIPNGIKGCIIEFCKKLVFDIWFGYIIPKSGTKLPDGRMIYFDDYQKTECIKNIGENILWGRKNLVEMVVHPSISPNHPFFGTLTDMRVKEWKMFSSPDTLDYLRKMNIELVNFDSIK